MLKQVIFPLLLLHGWKPLYPKGREEGQEKKHNHLDQQGEGEQGQSQ